MGHRTLLTLAVTALLVTGGESVSAQDAPLEARLWVGWESEPVLRAGERARIQFRVSRDAYVAVFRIDTDGRVEMLAPEDPRDDGYRPGGREQELALARSPYWTVADDPGMGYMFLVASPVPFDFRRFRFHPDFGWDLSRVATTVYDDPYMAMDDFIAAILPDWQDIPYALDFVTYHVDAPRSYPRFLCYDCHTYRSFEEWNPYEAMCPSYQVVVYDDPYFYPLYRYAGTRVVYPRLIPDRPRYEVTPRRSGEAWAPIVRVRGAPAARVTFKEPPAATGRPPATGRSISVGAPRGDQPRATGRAPSSARPPSVRERPPVREPSSVRGARRATAPSRGGVAPTGAATRRPTAGRAAVAPGGAATRRPSARPSTRPGNTAPARGAGRGVRPPTRPSAGSGGAARSGRGGAAAARGGGRPDRRARPPGGPGGW